MLAAVDELVTLSKSLSAMTKVLECVATGGCAASGPNLGRACLLAGMYLAHVSGDLSRVSDEVDRLHAGRQKTSDSSS